MKTLDKNLGDIVKKRKKAQAELEASRSVFPRTFLSNSYYPTDKETG
jgi:hypothetical protein